MSTDSLPPFSPNLLALRSTGIAVAMVGHSMLDQAVLFTGNNGGQITAVNHSLQHWPAWVSMLSGGRLKFPAAYKFAVSGWTSTQVLGTPIPATYTISSTTFCGNPGAVGKTQVAAAIACPAPIVAIQAYHNDPGNGVGLTTTISNYTAMIQQLTAAGKKVLLCIDPPSGNANFTAYRWNTIVTSGLARANAFRKWCLTQAPQLAPGNVEVVDFFRAVLDQAAGTSLGPSGGALGDALLGSLVDGVHESAYGGWLEAQLAIPALLALAPPYAMPAKALACDAYDATNNSTGNLCSSLTFLDSGSAQASYGAGVTVTGNKPTNYTVTADSTVGTGSASLTVAQTYVKLGNGAAGVQLAVSGTSWGAPGGSCYLYFQPNNSMFGYGTVGDVFTSSLDFEVAGGGTGFQGVECYLSHRRTSDNQQDLVICGGQSSLVWDSILVAGAVAASVPPDYGTRPWDGTETALYVGPRLRFASGQAVNFTARLANHSVNKVAPMALVA